LNEEGSKDNTNSGWNEANPKKDLKEARGGGENKKTDQCRAKGVHLRGSPKTQKSGQRKGGTGASRFCELSS